MQLDKDQQKIVDASDKRIVVVSSSGAGKSATLIERAKRLLNEGLDPRGLVIITFTRSAAEEVRSRLGHPMGVYVGTVHGYANYLLRLNGIDTSDIIEEEEFDKLFERIKMLNPTTNVECLMLDEAQDSTQEQFDFIFKYVKPKSWILIGDIRQSIYRFAGATPDYLLKLMKRKDVKTYTLDNNYRCGSSIVEFAKPIISKAGLEYYDFSESRTGTRGRVINEKMTLNGFAHYLKKNVLSTQWKDWFVLCRTNQQLEDFALELSALKIPYITFKRADIQDNADLALKIGQNAIKLLTIHASKSLESRNVLVLGARMSDIEERCISYVAATRAKDLLVWGTIQPSKSRRKTFNEDDYRDFGIGENDDAVYFDFS